MGEYFLLSCTLAWLYLSGVYELILFATLLSMYIYVYLDSSTTSTRIMTLRLKYFMSSTKHPYTWIFFINNELKILYIYNVEKSSRKSPQNIQQSVAQWPIENNMQILCIIQPIECMPWISQHTCLLLRGAPAQHTEITRSSDVGLMRLSLKLVQRYFCTLIAPG